MAPDASASPPSGEALAKLKAIVGAKGWIDAPDDLAPWLTDRRGHYTGRCALMVRPASTREVADIMALCIRTIELLRLHWTTANSRNIAISRRTDVECLDSFIGPKW